VNNDERLIQYLEGDHDAPDPPAEFVGIRDQLASESMWLEPPAELQEAIVADITGQRSTAPAPRQMPRHRTARRARRWTATAPWVAVAAVAAAVVLAAVFAFPRAETRQLQLTGTDFAANATAIATIRTTPSGEDITLDISGLPEPPPGHFYQGWVRQGTEPTDNAVTIGTFHMRGGDDEVTLWAGVDIDDFPVLTVTLEPDDGDPASSGQVVLRGRLEP
jgi:anti-sigma-K factor RskA